jgi:hypothetical protein
MTDKLNEYKDYPQWIDNVTPEEQYEWYLFAKKIIADTSHIVTDSSLQLAKAVKDYELKHNIK